MTDDFYHYWMRKGFAGIYRASLEEFQGADKAILISIILNCNYEDKPDFRLLSGKNFPLKRGQWITSISSLESHTGLTISKIRTALKHLESREIISTQNTVELTNKGRLITLVNTDHFLHRQEDLARQNTGKEQSKSKVIATNKKVKNNKKGKECFGIDKSIPAYILQETWNAFMEIRAQKKATKSDNALNLIINDLEKLRGSGGDPNKILEQSIMNGWSGVFPLKNNANKQSIHNLEGLNYDEGAEGFDVIR